MKFTGTKNYVATVIEVDRALEELLTKLEEADNKLPSSTSIRMRSPE